MPLKTAILASGSGTNAERIISLCRGGKLDADPALLISNRPDAPALRRAEKFGVPILALDHKAFKSRAAFDSRMAEAIERAGCGLVVLAGYMRLLTPEFLRAFPDRVINIHPALLPSFPGTHAARDALEWGVKISGVTAHFVEEEMDSGPAIIQAAVPVRTGESPNELQARIHAAEYRIYPQAIQWLAQGRVIKKGRQVFIKEDGKPPAKKTGAPEGCLIWPPLEEDF